MYDIQLWSVSDGGLVGVMRGHRRGIWSVQFSPVDQVRPLHIIIFFISLILFLTKANAHTLHTHTHTHILAPIHSYTLTHTHARTHIGAHSLIHTHTHTRAVYPDGLRRHYSEVVGCE